MVMKKIVVCCALLAGFCLSNCHGNRSENTDTGSIDSVAATTENLDIEQPPQRDEFRFVASFSKNSDGRYDRIMVKGYVGNDESPYFEKEHELIEPLDEGPTFDQEKWINDKIDINFDGIPDLLIYIGMNAVGRVSEFYDAYIWNAEGLYFEKVKGFDAIANPNINAKAKSISSSYRSGANEITEEIYKWKNGKLELSKTSKEKIIDDED